MLLSLSSHSNFDKILEKHISGQDLLTIKNVFIHLNKEVSCPVWTLTSFAAAPLYFRDVPSFDLLVCLPG